MNLQKLKIKKSGFALLFSVLVSSLLLAIGASILHINYKEYLLSGFGKESQKAFYVADVGSECALYWDIKHTGSANSPFATSSSPYNLDCSGVTNIPVSGPSVNGGVYTYTIIATLPPENYYMNVTVEKKYADLDDNGSKEYLLTTIDSRGSNVTPTTPSNKRVERGVRLQY
jgi:hypothetical protein